MLAAILSLSSIHAPTSGLQRTLDLKKRTYWIHLAIQDAEPARTLDYRCDLRIPKRKAAPELGKYAFVLSDLTMISTEVRQHVDKSGAGDLTVGPTGVPSEILPDGWMMMPLLALYLPQPSATVETDIPEPDIALGRGWKLSGTGRIGLDQLKGQPVHFKGVIESDQHVKFDYACTEIVNSADGWLKDASGSITGVGLSVKFEIGENRMRH